MQGILIVDKPMDWTSFDVVAKLRGVLGTRKLGHSGTLDPMATGVLPVFCGGASKAVDLQLDHDKAYRAVLRLGQRTDTGDITGTVLETAPVTAGERELRAVLPQFVGKQMQVPPMYSAVKVGGQPLYKLAREGKTVERKARPIEIYSITYGGSPAENEYVLEVTCSKGTYIRTLLEDIADALGQKGTMSALRRTCAGLYTEADAHTLEEILAAKEQGPAALEALMLPVESVFTPLPRGGWPLPGAQCRRAVPGAGQHHRGRAPGGKTVRGTELTRKKGNQYPCRSFHSSSRCRWQTPHRAPPWPWATSTASTSATGPSSTVRCSGPEPTGLPRRCLPSGCRWTTK